MIYLYTENFDWYPRLKNRIKNILGKNQRGPQAVIASLERGLSGLGVAYQINGPLPKNPATVGVLSGVATLKWAIRAKQKGLIKTLIAGPIIGMPRDAGGIMFHQAIDIFLLPSSWVADFCENFCPGFKSKVKIWAAGVKTQGLPSTVRRGCLIYKKIAAPQIYDYVLSELKQRKIDYTVIEYGSFSQNEYYNQLRRCEFMVYFSASESQGIALNEAWMFDVPTLVYGGGHLSHNGYEFTESSPAPYLSASAGMIFKGQDDFAGSLGSFLENLKSFHPRKYHLENFTDEISAKNYLKIINP